MENDGPGIADTDTDTVWPAIAVGGRGDRE